MSKCTQCGEIKPLSEFHKRPRAKSGYRYECKVCGNKQQKNWKRRNPEKVKVATKRFYAQHKEELNEKLRAQYRTDERFREQVKARVQKWYRDHPDKVLSRKLKWVRERLEADPAFRLEWNLRTRLRHAIKKNYKSARTTDLLGCDRETLVNHLEAQFTEGMTWDNYGEWHVDHIKECFRFNLSDPVQQRACFNYKNLRPLWAHDNLSRKKATA